MNLFKTAVILLLFIVSSSCFKKNNKNTNINKLPSIKHKVKKQVSYKKDFLWREAVYSKEVGDSISKITINKDYADTIPKDEKAAITYVLTFIDNACSWQDGNTSIDKDKLICKGLSSLGFDYQCSKKHISFLKTWFVNDTTSLKKIDRCPPFFPGVTISSTISKISLKKTATTLVIYATKSSYNSRTQKTREWTDIYTFISGDKNIALQEVKKL